ncbi:MAG: sulfite exporter TauE/SafE family protein [Acidobacteria bacterium]|nr:sulfite exporter TauE/SafE family protein [Acidobacteriota bacterium]
MEFFIKPLVLFLTGAIAAIMNSVAGGGTLLSFPALMFWGLPAIAANATSTLAMLVGTSTSALGYRRELVSQKRWAWRFAPPSLLGGLVGAILLLETGEAQFRAIVPYLILFAALLFTFQGTVTRWLQIEAHAIERSRHGILAAIFFQFCVATYGGYFGAGLGILMLATLGVLGHNNIHEMNSLKMFLGMLINSVAATYFIVSGAIHWPEMLLVGAGALVGGYAGPHLARKVGQRIVRAFVSVVGFGIGIYFLLS